MKTEIAFDKKTDRVKSLKLLPLTFADEQILEVIAQVFVTKVKTQIIVTDQATNALLHDILFGHSIEEYYDEC